jgi:hypothetical protein
MLFPFSSNSTPNFPDRTRQPYPARRKDRSLPYREFRIRKSVSILVWKNFGPSKMWKKYRIAFQ